MQIVVGLLARDGGEVERPGALGYCPQLPMVWEKLTVDEHFELFARAYGLDDEARAAAERAAGGAAVRRLPRLPGRGAVRRDAAEAQPRARADARAGAAAARRALRRLRLGDLPALLGDERAPPRRGHGHPDRLPPARRARAARPHLRPRRRKDRRVHERACCRSAGASCASTSAPRSPSSCWSRSRSSSSSSSPACSASSPRRSAARSPSRRRPRSAPAGRPPSSAARSPSSRSSPRARPIGAWRSPASAPGASRSPGIAAALALGVIVSAVAFLTLWLRSGIDAPAPCRRRDLRLRRHLHRHRRR